jgi:hypothetical protein
MNNTHRKGRAMKTHLSRTLALLIVAGLSLAISADTTQATYSSAQSAVDAFVAATRKYTPAKMTKIFGDSSDKLFLSQDPVADENQRDEFLRLYKEKHKLITRSDGAKMLVVGKSQWPFPVPLVKEGSRWQFDSPAGFEEIVNRRIGRNELDTIQTILAIGDGQREYYRQDRDGDGVLEYAQHFRSSEGQHDGLYWPVKNKEALSPLGAFVADAADEGYSAANDAYHGYHYKLLYSQGSHAAGGAYDYMVRNDQIGGFAVLAYPASYGESGVMTFVMSHAGLMFQRDLGPSTPQLVQNITSFDPDATWSPISDRDMKPLPADPNITGE